MMKPAAMNPQRADFDCRHRWREPTNEGVALQERHARLPHRWHYVIRHKMTLFSPDSVHLFFKLLVLFFNCSSFYLCLFTYFCYYCISMCHVIVFKRFWINIMICVAILLPHFLAPITTFSLCTAILHTVLVALRPPAGRTLIFCPPKGLIKKKREKLGFNL